VSVANVGESRWHGLLGMPDHRGGGVGPPLEPRIALAKIMQESERAEPLNVLRGYGAARGVIEALPPSALLQKSGEHGRYIGAVVNQ